MKIGMARVCHSWFRGKDKIDVKTIRDHLNDFKVYYLLLFSYYDSLISIHRFYPSVLLYLLVVVPSIWVMEWQIFFHREEYRRNNSISSCEVGDFEDIFDDKLMLPGLPNDVSKKKS